MQLAYGKFDPDLTPPPFSGWSKSLTAVEIDLFQYDSWKPKISAYLDSWVKRKNIRIIPRIGIRTHRSVDEYQDAINLWLESYCEETIFLVHSGRKEWVCDQTITEIKKLPQTEKYFFEWRKVDSIAGVEFIKKLECFQGWVVDPEWHHSSISGLNNTLLNFQLHG